MRSNPDGLSGGTHEAVRIRLLGGFSVSVGPRAIREGEWHLRKAADLVKLVALAPGHRLHREQVMDILWPGLGKKAAANNLRQALHAARRALDKDASSGYLASRDESLALCPGGQLWVDVDAFEAAAATARRERSPAACRAAVHLYEGGLLPDDRYEDWTEDRRQELRRVYLSLLVELAELHEERHEVDPAIEALSKAVVEDPSHEAAHSGLMRLYARSGNRAEALRQYGRLAEALAREIGAEPSTATRRLKEEIATGRFSLSEPVRPPSEERPDPSKHNLPAPRTSFVGRERQMVEVKRLLSMTRLLTLTGAGGSGKTRLALEVSRDLTGVYPDGVRLVELASLSEGTLVPQVVANTLSVREQPGRPLTDTMTEALRDKELLLVLDNCEHIANEAAQLVDVLLDSCPGLRVLATSREALNVAGEVVSRVPPLSLPDPHEPLAVEKLEGQESARLFVERARQRDRSFILTPSNTRSVVEICRKLDGLPLAIELAAARVGTLSIEQISRRLDDALGLLTGGRRTAAARQRTLQGALDWSHDLLNESERATFRRLSVFAGGWTLEAAGAVAPGEGVAENDILELLSGFADKSLVVVEATDDGRVRHRLLEPVRQYALKKLVEAREAETVRRRHAEFFLGLAKEGEPELLGPEQGAWLQEFESEHDNLRAALSWAFAQGDAELGMQLGVALWRFWLRRGHGSEGRGWLARGLQEGSTVSAPVRAAGRETLGMLVQQQGDFGLASALYKEALILYRELEDEQNAADCHLHLADLVILRGDYERATALLEGSLRHYRKVADTGGIASVLTSLASIACAKTDGRERATELLEEALTLYGELGDSWGVAMTLGDLGWVEIVGGNYGRAAELLEEALARSRQVRVKQASAGLLTRLALAALGQGDHERASALLEEGLVLGRELDHKLNIAWSLEGMAMVAAAEGMDERAARLWGAAEGSREAIGAPLRADERAVYEPYLSDSRYRLGAEAWEAGKDGRKMALEEAVEYALSEEESPAATLNVPERVATDEPLGTLTRREQEIATLVARGLTNRQISAELHISEHTAATHVGRILKKLGLRSRAQIGTWLAAGQRPSSTDPD